MTFNLQKTQLLAPLRFVQVADYVSKSTQTRCQPCWLGEIRARRLSRRFKCSVLDHSGMAKLFRDATCSDVCSHGCNRMAFAVTDLHVGEGDQPKGAMQNRPEDSRDHPGLSCSVPGRVHYSRLHFFEVTLSPNPGQDSRDQKKVADPSQDPHGQYQAASMWPQMSMHSMLCGLHLLSVGRAHSSRSRCDWFCKRIVRLFLGTCVRIRDTGAGGRTNGGGWDRVDFLATGAASFFTGVFVGNGKHVGTLVARELN